MFRFTVTRERYPVELSRAKRLGGKPVRYKVLVPLTEIYEGKRSMVPIYYPLGNESLEPHTLTSKWGIFPDRLPPSAPRRLAEMVFPEVKTIAVEVHPNDLPPYGWYLAEEYWTDEIKEVQLDEIPKEWLSQKVKANWNSYMGKWRG